MQTLCWPSEPRNNTFPSHCEPGLTPKQTTKDTIMKLSQAFPSNFLKADDLNGQTVTVTISSVEVEELGQGKDKERRLVISFKGKEKKFVCNKTNASTIEGLYGDETDNWIGQRITIAPREVEFQGKMVWAIRVSLQKPGAAPAQAVPKAAPAPAPAPAVPAAEQGDDSVPF